MIDSHAHLDSKEFDQDLNQILERCQEKNVRFVISCGTDLSSSQKNLDLSKQNPMIFAAIGVHPHETYLMDENTIEKLKELSKEMRVIAIGETGLDYYYNFSLPEVQRKAFRVHIRLARERGLPLVIHCRNSEEDLIKILKEEKASEVGGVIHCFSGRKETALACLEFGFYLGVSGMITFKNTKDLSALFSELPMERLLVETDSPYLAPHPYRGKRNEPSYVVHTALKLAELKNLTLEKVENQTTENVENLFQLNKVNK